MFFYLFIYVLTTVNLLRTLRYLQYHEDESNLSKVNFSYTLMILLGAVVLGTESVRGALGFVLSWAYDLLVKVLVVMVSIVLTPLVYLMEGVIQKVMDYLMLAGEGKLERFFSSSGTVTENHIQSMDGSTADLWLRVQEFLELPVKILIAVLLFYGMVRLISGRRRARHGDEGYLERRESIVGSGKRKGAFFRVTDFLAARRGSEAIRYYYRLFLRLSLRKGIDIRRSDTTEEINEKCSGIYNREMLESLRERYIEVRYGEKKCGEERVREVREIVRRLG